VSEGREEREVKRRTSNELPPLLDVEGSSQAHEGMVASVFHQPSTYISASRETRCRCRFFPHSPRFQVRLTQRMFLLSFSLPFTDSQTFAGTISRTRSISETPVHTFLCCFGHSLEAGSVAGRARRSGRTQGGRCWLRGRRRGLVDDFVLGGGGREGG